MDFYIILLVFICQWEIQIHVYLVNASPDDTDVWMMVQRDYEICIYVQYYEILIIYITFIGNYLIILIKK
jgi:hypothetical protein